MAGRVPLALVFGSRARAGKVGLPVDTRVPALVEGHDLDVVVGILLNDTSGIIVRIERVHEDERNVDLVFGVEVLDLSNTEIQESHSLSDFNDGFGSNATHGGTETSVELQDS